MASNSFAFPLHKKERKMKSITSSQYPVEISDFSGLWGHGTCTGFDEEEEGDVEESNDLRLTITQNKEQISITFGGYWDPLTVVLNLNQFSAQNNNTPEKMAVSFQHVGVPYSDMIAIDYEHMNKEWPPGTGSTIRFVSLHVLLIKDGDTLKMQDIFSREECIYKKIG